MRPECGGRQLGCLAETGLMGVVPSELREGTTEVLGL